MLTCRCVYCMWIKIRTSSLISCFIVMTFEMAAQSNFLKLLAAILQLEPVSINTAMMHKHNGFVIFGCCF